MSFGRIPSALSTFFFFCFGRLPSALSTFLVRPQNKQLLVSVLKNHILGSRLLSKDMLYGALDTLDPGSTLFLTVDETGVQLRDSGVYTARVTQPDILARNGVLHVLDGLLLPARLVSPVLDMLRPLSHAPTHVVDIVRLTESRPQLSVLASLLSLARVQIFFHKHVGRLRTGEGPVLDTTYLTTASHRWPFRHDPSIRLKPSAFAVGMLRQKKTVLSMPESSGQSRLDERQLAHDVRSDE